VSDPPSSVNWLPTAHASPDGVVATASNTPPELSWGVAATAHFLPPQWAVKGCRDVDCPTAQTSSVAAAATPEIEFAAGDLTRFQDATADARPLGAAYSETATTRAARRDASRTRPATLVRARANVTTQS
jgi:hypothetical protein